MKTHRSFLSDQRRRREENDLWNGGHLSISAKRDYINSRRESFREFGSGTIRSLAAIPTRSASESAFIFRITFPRCAFTVISEIPSSPAACLFNKPEITNAM